jgi:lipoprotein-releasing system ATP-binding protein
MNDAVIRPSDRQADAAALRRAAWSPSRCCAASIWRSQPGEIVALLGPSGSGKSTMLQAVGLLEGGLPKAKSASQARARRSCTATGERTLRPPQDSFGLHLSVPPSAARLQRHRECHAAAADHRIRLTEAGAREGDRNCCSAISASAQRLDHRPSATVGWRAAAGGRGACARQRAEVLVLADEPTGNLDEATADIVFQEFVHLVREEGSAHWWPPITKDWPHAWTGLSACTMEGSHERFRIHDAAARWQLQAAFRL